MPVTMSAVSIMSFTPTGMPSMAERGVRRAPARRRGLGRSARLRRVDYCEGAYLRLPPVDFGQTFLEHLHR